VANAQVVELEVVGARNLLAAGTHGRGMFTISLGQSTVPAVVSTSLTGTVSAPVTDDIITFNEAVNPATFTTGQFSLTDPNGNPVTISSVTPADGTNTTFDANLASQSTAGTYSVSIGPNIYDFNGNPMAAPYTTTFTVAATTGNLIVNGGFETGDFTGWTQSGDLSFTAVNGNLPHGGSFAAEMGPTGADGFLSQTFATTPGANYTLDYWLEDGGGPNDFAAYINGVAIPGSVFVNDPGFAYTEFTFVFTASGPSTTLAFGFLQVPAYWHLDDVSVVPGPAPAPHGGSGGASHGQVAAVPAGISGMAGSIAAPDISVAQGTSAVSHQVDQAALVDHVFSASAKDGTAALPGMGLTTGTAAPPAPVAQGTSGWTRQASFPADQAAVVDHLFSGVGTKDYTASLPSRPLMPTTPADPVGLTRLGEAPWLL
jgi:hypothetical protein